MDISIFGNFLSVNLRKCYLHLLFGTWKMILLVHLPLESEIVVDPRNRIGVGLDIILSYIIIVNLKGKNMIVM